MIQGFSLEFINPLAYSSENISSTLCILQDYEVYRNMIHELRETSNPPLAITSENMLKYNDKDMEIATRIAVKNALRNFKQDMEEIIECIICKSIPSEGQMMQCEDGHLACEQCMKNQYVTNCALCRKPLGNKKIRSLVIEQLIEKNNMTVSCKNSNCIVKSAKDSIKLHHLICEWRLINCLNPKCEEKKPYNTLKNHMILDDEDIYLGSNKSGVVKYGVGFTLDILNSNSDLMPNCRLHKYKGEDFASIFHRTNGTWYAYTYIFGNAEKAKNFKVKISVQKPNREGGIFNTVEVFPIDTKRADILTAYNEVLSFGDIGIAKQFFVTNGNKLKIEFSFEIMSKPIKRKSIRMY